jgi:DNA-directed RNA polymerase subunit RPC12/RpoP
MNIKVSCPYCHNRWFLDDEAIAFAMENSPKKGRSIGVECPRCRKLVKVARPKRPPTPLPPPEKVKEE